MLGIKNILIVWWGTSWYLSVYYLLKKFPNINITWIYPEINNTIWVWEATIPYVTRFLRDLWIDLETILSDCDGSIKLWLNFEDFYEKWKSFNHWFWDWDGLKFWLINNYLISNDLVNEKLLKSKFNYAVHFDVKKLTSYLDANIEKYSNINIIREEIWEISKDDFWNIISIWDFKADFFIDCTWFDRLLINNVCKDNFVDITDKIPNNSALIYRWNYTNREKQFKAYTTAKAMNYWWCWHIPLKNQLSLWYVHDDKYDVLDEFKKHLENIFWEISDKDIYKIKMKTWRNREHICKNTMSIWLSSCFIEPLESTGLFFVVFNIELLWKYLNNKINANTANNLINNNFDVTIDFILAHYIWSKNSNKYWGFYKDKKIKYFQNSNLFWYSNWYMILKGMCRMDILKKYIWNNKMKELDIYEKYIYKNWVEGSVDYNKYYFR